MQSISELKTRLQQAELIEQQQAAMPNDQYSSTLHYLAIDNSSRIKYQLLNHPDLTVADHDRLVRVKGDIPYPASC